MAGLRGSLSNGFAYDLSLSIGRNETAFRIENTWNPSLGPDSPRAFDLGVYRQTERNYHADFLFPLPVAAFASDLNLAFGAEYRVETFEIALGEEDSWRAGPYALQNANFHSEGVTPLPAMTIGAHGFPGFNPSQAGEFDRGNYAIYADVGADLTPDFLLDAALHFEDFDDFGTTLNGKMQAHWHLRPSFGLCGSFSTGFRAPTPGQSNVEESLHAHHLQQLRAEIKVQQFAGPQLLRLDRGKIRRIRPLGLRRRLLLLPPPRRTLARAFRQGPHLHSIATQANLQMELAQDAYLRGLEGCFHRESAMMAFYL